MLAIVGWVLFVIAFWFALGLGHLISMNLFSVHEPTVKDVLICLPIFLVGIVLWFFSSKK